MSLLALPSCTDKESSVLTENTVENARLGADGFLLIKNAESFKNLQESLKGKTREEMEAWEAAKGFRSLKSEFEQAVDEETAFYDAAAAWPADKIEKIKKSGNIPHSAFVQARLGKTLLLEESGVIRANIDDLNLAAFVDKNGLIQIGSDIYRFRKQEVKIIRGGDLSKLALLETIEENNTALNIEVWKIKGELQNNMKVKAMSGTWTCDSDSLKTVKERVWGSANLGYKVTWDPFSGVVWCNELLYIQAENTYRNIFGTYNLKRTSALRMAGTLNILDSEQHRSFQKPVDLNTGGDLMSKIQTTVYKTNVCGTPEVQYMLQVDGRLDVYGRNSQSCFLVIQ